MKPTEFLNLWLHQTPPPWKIGEIKIQPGFTVLHQQDDPNQNSLRSISLENLTELVKSTPAGNFRPLRSSPDLPSGWILTPLSFEDLVLALRILYPSAISHWSAWSQQILQITPYQETAERQTGMYHCTRLLTLEQRQSLTQSVCATECMKKRLWEPADTIETKAQEIPLICAEACNYFIPKAREVVKSMIPKKNP